MYGQKITLYDVLEVRRDAKHTDIVRAYRKHTGQLEQETAPPDPKRRALLHEAYEVLSDPERREVYDKSLRKPTFLGVSARAEGPAKIVAAVAGLAVMSVALYLALRSERDPAAEPLPKSQVASTASVATGRVRGIDVSGKITPLGLAFAIKQGVMVSNCEGVKPGSQLVVEIPPRSLPARVVSSGGVLGTCQLAVEGVGAFPLPLRGFGPHVNEKVYATNINAGGELVLRETKVRRVVDAPEAQIIETPIVVAMGDEGGPLLDMLGRVVGLAAPSRHIGIPREWADDAPARRAPEPEAQEAKDTKQTKMVDAPSRDPEAVGRKVDSIKAGRDDAIDKAAGGK
jgi:DnaJ-like protein/trypsin-like peptidase